MGDPFQVDVVFHTPAKVPAYLKTSTGYVLADPKGVYTTGQHTLTMEKHKPNLFRQNMFLKGEATLRRNQRRVDRLVAAVPNPAHLRYLTGDAELPVVQTPASRTSSRSDKRKKPPPPPPQTIRDFMHKPRKYNMITLKEGDAFSSGYEEFKRKEFDETTASIAEAAVSAAPQLPLIPPEVELDGSGFVRRKRMYAEQFKNGTSSHNTAVLPEKEPEVPGDFRRIDPRQEALSYRHMQCATRQMKLREYQW